MQTPRDGPCLCSEGISRFLLSSGCEWGRTYWVAHTELSLRGKNAKGS